MKIVVFSGAGLSKESGIPTFRDSNGLWENFKIEEVATPKGWHEDKDKVLNFYAARWANVKNVQPNAAHKAIAALQDKHEVINITQNIDDLLERAGCKTVWHLHGSINRRKCEFHKNVFDDNMGCDYECDQDKPAKLGDMCPKCNGQTRPDVVWFGEYVDTRDKYLEQLVDTADVFIGVGTSAQVYPAAGFIVRFHETKHKCFIDPNPHSSLENLGFIVFKGAASEWMPQITKHINNKEEAFV